MIILRTKSFALKDYENLDEATAQELRQKRSEIAKSLRKKRKSNNRDMAQGIELEYRNSNHEFAQREAREAAERERLAAIERSTSTRLGETGSNSLNNKPNPTPTPNPKPTSTPKLKQGNKVLGLVKKNLGKVALGTAATAGLAYGAKKAYDHHKNKKNENNT